jgi:hypothetical protein
VVEEDDEGEEEEEEEEAWKVAPLRRDMALLTVGEAGVTTAALGERRGCGWLRDMAMLDAPAR